MLSIETLRIAFRNKIYIPLSCKARRRKLDNTNFTIISNNCWGGTVYEAYNLPKESPTVGMFFMADDYIKFISDLKGYINGALSFIYPEKSKWKDSPQVSSDRRFSSYPIGVLSNGYDTIEVFFLHYHSEWEAKSKWERRIKRINWNKLLIKFNDQNGCTEKNLEDFCDLPFKHKIFFTCKEWKIESKSIIKISQPAKSNSILASYEPFEKTKLIDIAMILNAL